MTLDLTNERDLLKNPSEAELYRSLLRSFRRFVGPGGDRELIELLARTAPTLAKKYEIDTPRRWQHFAAQWAFLTNGLSEMHVSIDDRYCPSSGFFGQLSV